MVRATGQKIRRAQTNHRLRNAFRTVHPICVDLIMGAVVFATAVRAIVAPQVMAPKKIVAPMALAARVVPALLKRHATTLASALHHARQTVPEKIVEITAAGVVAEPVAPRHFATQAVVAKSSETRHRHRHRSSNAAAPAGRVAQTAAAQNPAELAVPGSHAPVVGSASQPHVATKGNRVEEHPDPAAAMESVVAECATRRQTRVGAHRAIQDLAVEISATVVPDTSRL